jgi:hypothetical protein
MRFHFDGHITPEDKAGSDYMLLPFDLPVPAQSLTVRYRYSDRITADKSEGGNVIDIGLFDPQGADFPGGAGFRGWSGSGRTEFTVGTTEATPGYIPGPLPAGRYHVIFGLYRIWPQGAHYELQIEAKPADAEDLAGVPAPIPPAAASQPETPVEAAGGWHWLRGDLQCHSNHSDGKGPLDFLVAKARAAGLDYLAVTDHNTISSHAYLDELAGDDLILIPGQEVTTYYGHMNVWGTRQWCDFRCRHDEDMRAVIDLAHGYGALCSMNHPAGGDLAWDYSTGLPVDAFEVWNGPWPNHNRDSLELWDQLLQNGRRLAAVGGSDYHCPSGEETGFVRLGQPTTWVKATGRSETAVLDAIRRGRTCVTASPDGPRLELRARADGVAAEMGDLLPVTSGQSIQVTVEIENGRGYMLRLITERGVVQESAIDSNQLLFRDQITADRYVRAELVADMPATQLPAQAPANLDLREWRWAISNPIYVQLPAEWRGPGRS